ncbi:MAG: hypothetical protein COT74_09540 [Bdellovibrionales bacterium CG10_big_fil_rev_8_21_14_0_10_45_34]|nr:MAG: hypothetical protein COT74_09540 [Bdellovibrionales bacterium CG10_big_fil_rev_8_21_14_0_10_45_34]
MFNLGFGELIIIAVLGLLLLGPKQLPELARVIGRFINELKRASEDVTSSFMDARDRADHSIRKVKKQVTDIHHKVQGEIDQTRDEIINFERPLQKLEGENLLENEEPSVASSAKSEIGTSKQNDQLALDLDRSGDSSAIDSPVGDSSKNEHSNRNS